MTVKSHKKAFVQLDRKPIVKQKYIKHNRPKKRKCGNALKPCKRCGRYGGHVSQYKIDMCRQCFRDMAKIIGFKKFN